MPQRLGFAWVSVNTSTMDMVVPYMSIMSPGSRTPTLIASDQGSMVPAATGVPAGIPVTSAAAVVASPATSDGHSSRGSARPGATSLAHSSIQRFSFMS
jgi:hypothetical protein